jgi:23S rRNA (cytidine1920-2'-O)/16S rRNA (cytidine1409-2'-O)-methyltransferase
MTSAGSRSSASATLRLDIALVARGLAPTRARARDAVLRGHVRVNGARADKPAMIVPAVATISIDDPATGYVSRGALKLIAGLDHFGYDPAGRNALDLGASTGGFSEVLLRRGARRVIAIDVGHDQLDPRLAADPRLTVRDRVNVRDLAATDLPEPAGALVADLSFISLKLALPAALALAGPGAWGLFLVKPQFEVGRAALGKGGIVREALAAERAADGIAAWLASQPGWRVDGLIESPISGGSGNREFLLGGGRD